MHTKSDKKICFVASTPKDSEPKNVNRDKILFYISNWPKDKVTNEVSVKIGYPFKPESNPTVEVGTDKFQMFAKNDKAFIASAETERKLIEAMKKGNTMIVRGLSKRGTNTTDRYSLSGLTAVLEKMGKDCSK